MTNIIIVLQRGGEGSLKDFSAVGVVRFSYKELVDATGNFSKQLGGGGFGPVHKGTLGDKSEVAVKTLQKLKQGEQEFRTEVAVIGDLNPSQTLNYKCPKSCIINFLEVARNVSDCILASRSLVS